jgi:hypothetical protein
VAWATTVTVYPPDGSGGGVDLSCLVDQVTVHHGRDDSGTQPEASTLGLDFTVTPDDPLPALVEIGSVITVTHATGTLTSQRFRGRITDVALGWEAAGEDTPDNGVGQLTAVGTLADLGRRVIGDVPWPQELDGSRVARVMAAAGVTLDPLYSDPGTVQIVARDVDSQPALGVAQSVAESGSGVLWQTKDGAVRYADAMHRRAIPVSLTLDACDILVTPTWRRTLEGLVNSVSIGYGIASGSEQQPRYVDSNAASIARYETWGYSVSTELAALADAQALGQTLLVRNSSPIWVMGTLPVDIDGLSAADYDALLSLDMHSLVSLTGLPAIGAAPTTAALWVEGWREVFEYRSHTIELVVSGYCRTVPPPLWDDVDPAWLWGGETITEQRRNLCANPSFENGVTYWGVNATYWTNAGATLTPDPAWAIAGGKSGRVDCDGAANQQGITCTFGARPGTTYTVSATIRSLTGRPVAIKVRDQTNLSNAPFSAAVAAGQTARVAATITTGAAANPVVLVGIATDTTLGASSFYVDAVLIEETATPGPYFDGDTPDTGAFDYAWTGPANLSPSTLSEVARIPGGVDPALTWDDLSCLGPPAYLGRWNDQPASLRWDQIDPATSWNNYGG